MIIVNKNISRVPFGKLSCGDIFKDKYGNICMKMETTDCGVNTVRLSDGSYDYTAGDDDEIELIKGQLVIG